MVWLYEKVLRQRAGTSAGRFGISLVARPRELYAMEERQNINAIVNARLAGETEEYRSTNRIGTRATVVKELWEALPDERREAWAEYGRTIEAGTGTLQMKDEYVHSSYLRITAESRNIIYAVTRRSTSLSSYLRSSKLANGCLMPTFFV